LKIKLNSGNYDPENKKEKMKTLSPSTEKLIEKYNSFSNQTEKKDSGETIHVDEIAKRVASFYDKIRGIIDWKGEHLLRRSAIERTLRRKTLPKVNILSGGKTKVDAESLILDLIRAGHLPNDTIKESKIDEVQKALNKYVYILNNLPSEKEIDYGVDIYQWLTSIAACEVEEILSPAKNQKYLIEYMFAQMKERVEVEKGYFEDVDKKTKNTLLYIAVQRALYNLDEPIITYHLFKYTYSDWSNLPKKELKNITSNIYKIRKKIDFYFNHKLETKLYHLCKKQSTPYLLLGDILEKGEKNLKETVSEPKSFEEKIKSVYEERVETMKSRLSRSATYATISIFITNVAALYALEIPLAGLMDYDYPFQAVLVTIFIPTMLMAAFVVTISPPPKKNLHKVIMESMKIVYHAEKKEGLKIKKPKKRGFVSDFLINFIWILSLFASIAVIIYGLSLASFPPLSYLIFIIFLSLISFAGTKIRDRAKELHMIDEKERFLNVLLDIFALPVIRLGKWFTNKWKRYNIISIFFSALIDLPFMSFIKFLEEWRSFLKEKREDIY